MTTPLSSQPNDAPAVAPLSADYYEKIVNTPPASRQRNRYLLFALTLVLAGGAFLHIRHIRANDSLRAAVMEHDAAEVRDLLRSGADPNQRYVLTPDETPVWPANPGTGKSQTLLMLAASSNSAEIVNELLTHGANPNIKLASGLTALLTVTPSDSATVKLLLAKGADIHIHNSEGRSPLHLAALSGNVEVAAMLLDAGADIEEKDAQGKTALYLAFNSFHGDQEMMRLLLAWGANLDALEPSPIKPFSNSLQFHRPYNRPMMRQKRFPLLRLAQHGDATLTTLFWDKKQDAEIRRALGTVALTNAIHSGLPETVKALLDRGVPVEMAPMADGPRPSADYVYSTPLMAAASKHDLPLCRLLIERGAKVNPDLGPGTGGTTPLVAAANATNGDIVRFLIEHGADINARNAQGETPLMLACNSPAATQALLEHKANVNARDNQGNTALIHTQNAEVMRLLLEAGADANGGTQDTMLLARASTPELVALLITRGAKVDERDSQGQTALMRTMYNNVVPALLEHGADPNARDNHWRTPLHYAVERMATERISLLAAHGAKRQRRRFRWRHPAINGKTAAFSGDGGCAGESRGDTVVTKGFSTRRISKFKAAVRAGY